jgi:vitamin B12 transporter
LVRRFFLLVATTLTLPSLCAQAQEALPETIVTATRIVTPAARVPAAVTVLSRQEIEERGYVTLADALSSVPGMRLVRQGGAGQPASAFLRGTNSRHVLVLLDGVPVNDPSDSNGAFNFGNELLGDIERIEVVRGPGSSLYGSSAIGGVINLVTRRAPAGDGVRNFGEIAAGTQRTVRGVFGNTGRAGAFDWMVAGQSLSTRGFDATAPRFFSNTGERDGLRGHAATARLGVRLDADTRIEGLLRWRENISGLDDVPNDDPNYSADDRRWYGQIRGETRLLDGAWTTGLRASITEDRRRYLNLPDAGSSAETDDLYRGERTVLDWTNRVRLPSYGPWTDVALAFGATREEESVEAASGSTSFRTVTDASARSIALHAGLQARLADRIDLSFGLRQDDSDDFGSFTSWRTGAVLALPELSSRLRVSAGTAFKAPSLFQRFGRIGTFFQGNPDLKPERSLSWEAGIETDVPAMGRSDFATFSATYFESTIKDLINFDQTATTLDNVERASIRGVEMGVTLRPAAWLQASASWTITDARDDDTDERLARRPEHVVTFSARVAPTDRLVLSPEILFTGRSPEAAFASYDNDGTASTTQRSNPAGTVVNITGSYRLTESITAFAEGRNLGNSRWEPANGFVTPGRSLLIGARASF